MFAFAVIKHLDLIKDITFSITSCLVDPSFDTFTFQQLEEALNNSIIMAVASSAHATLQSIGFEERLPVMASVLASLIGMHRYLLLGIAPPYRHQQRIQNDIFCNA